MESLASLSGLSQTQPLLALALAIFMFSLAGIPPLFGFWPKLMVFNAAVDAGLLPLAIAAAVLTVVGAYYYLKIVKIMYFDEPTGAFQRVREPLQTALIVVCALFVSPLGYLLINPIGRLAANAASIF